MMDSKTRQLIMPEITKIISKSDYETDFVVEIITAPIL